jgi:hypothetical protein
MHVKLNLLSYINHVKVWPARNHEHDWYINFTLCKGRTSLSTCLDTHLSKDHEFHSSLLRRQVRVHHEAFQSSGSMRKPAMDSRWGNIWISRLKRYHKQINLRTSLYLINTSPLAPFGYCSHTLAKTRAIIVLVVALFSRVIAPCSNQTKWSHHS